MPATPSSTPAALGLERLRTRLLDLTRRNRLINFRYTKRNALRVVDELPDQLFDRLLNGDELVFRPVPLPPKQGAQSDLMGGGGKGSVPVPVEAHARTVGIAASYDLPAAPSSGEGATKHRDRYVQTLLYPAHLERQLRHLTSAARTAIEESGTNMLFLAFGFLEWAETADADQRHLAPLLLLPVSLRRTDPDRATGAFQYAVSYSGEDVSANLSLQEKLKEFGLELPDPTEDDTPESYAHRVAHAVEPRVGWQVRRHVTLSLFSFGKLLMYRDLDPANWPAGHGPADHAIIRALFEGGRVEESMTAAEHPIDRLDDAGKLPPVVLDADSSQHSAIVDVMQGKSLVIEGPPGTGKSQTITNLIAAALSEGKTVLFVADKLAALEVVRKRLDDVGLGAFCLELHSHKTQKSALHEDIGHRLDSVHTFTGAQSLSAQEEALRGDRRRLSDYAARVNRPYEKLEGVLVYDLLWARERARQALHVPEGILLTLTPEGGAEWDRAGVEGRRHALRTLAQQFGDVSRGSSDIGGHPWYGAFRGRRGPSDEGEIAEALKFCREAAARFSDAMTHALATYGLEGPATPQRARALDNLRDLLPDPVGTEVLDALPALADSAMLRAVGSAVADLERFHQLKAQLAKLLRPGTAPDAVDVAPVWEAVRLARRLAPKIGTASALAVEAEGIQRRADALERLLEDHNRASATLDVTLPATPRELVTVTAATFDLAHEAPVAAFGLRTPHLHGLEGALEAERAEAEAWPLLGRRERLGERVDLARVPPADELEGHLRVVMAAGPFRWLSGPYHAARKAWRSLSIAGERLGQSELASAYRELLSYLKDVAAFDAAHDDRFGHGWKGLDTDFVAFQARFRWEADVRLRLPRGQGAGRSPAEALESATLEQVEALKRIAQEPSVWLDLVEEAREAINCQGPLALDLPVQPDTAPVTDIVGAMRAGADALARGAEALRAAGFADGLLLAGVEEYAALFEAYTALRAKLDAADALREAFPSVFAGHLTPVAPIRSTYRLATALAAAPIPADLHGRLSSPDYAARREALLAVVGRAVAAAEAFLEAHQAFESTAEVDLNAWYEGEAAVTALEPARCIGRADRALGALADLGPWLDYCRTADELIGYGFEPFVDYVEAEAEGAEEVARAGEFVLCDALARAAVAASPELATFSGVSHDQVRARFATLDDEVQRLTRRRIAHRVGARRITDWGNGTGRVAEFSGLHLLKHERRKQRRHIPIRQLVRRAGLALQELKPCFMMGPLAVAQYLEPGALHFDLVVMDEASQLRPEDALGAIARGSQLVVVGDPKQLPPTSFFDRLGDEDEPDEEQTALDEAESILDTATTVFQPTRRLRWHYRSRHGSLIAFSNHEFYKDLLVFPSPDVGTDEMGVRLVPVPDGVYENRQNEREAAAVVEAALVHLRTRPAESLGIVAMNSQQRDLIEGLLDKGLKDHPDLRAAVDEAEGLEPLFVKNLENVQGDERDVVMVSVTYGPDAHGRLYKRFGPINGAGGHRRLNVLFTRAKRRVLVFSSFDPDDLALSAESSYGARVLKGYLSFAKTGRLEAAVETARPPDSDFEVAVAEALRARGFDVVAQVGVAGYFLDLAVRHPRLPGRYALGIECDGATYHSSVSARDRDRLREAVLRELGWNIHRIWSADWFKNPGREIDEAVQAVRRAIGET